MHTAHSDCGCRNTQLLNRIKRHKCANTWQRISQCARWCGVCTSLPALLEPFDPEPSFSPSRLCQRQQGSLWRNPSPWARRATQRIHNKYTNEWTLQRTRGDKTTSTLPCFKITKSPLRYIESQLTALSILICCRDFDMVKKTLQVIKHIHYIVYIQWQQYITKDLEYKA